MSQSSEGYYNRAVKAYYSQNYTEAYQLFMNAYQLGNYKAATILGAMCADGLSIEKSTTEAFKWFALAAANGNATAQHYLGDYYRYANGVLQDYDLAITWYKKAAAQGNQRAIEKLKELTEDQGNKSLKQIPFDEDTFSKVDYIIE